jgi:membrane-bound lytic murein transglycosylase F
MPFFEAALLPREGYPIGHEMNLARKLARTLDLAFEIVTVQERDALLRALLEGKGDIVLASLTITPQRAEKYAFSVPLHHVKEVLVVPARNTEIRAPEDLAGRRVAVRGSSSYHGTLQSLQETIPVDIVTVPEHLDTEEILARVAEGEFDASVADDDLLEDVLRYRDDLKAAFDLTDPSPVAWAMRPDNPRLREAVNRFLQEEALVGGIEGRHTGDLTEMRERKVLRVLTRNNGATAYLYRGKQMGFEFELARRFARTLGCRLQLVIPPEHSDLIPWLLEGRGDLIAASMTVTPERSERVAFTAPYLTVEQTVVVRADEEEVVALGDLAGREITVRRSSGYFETLRRLAEGDAAPFTIGLAPEHLETEDLIAGVADGRYDATVADDHILGIELAWREDVRGAFVLGEPEEIAWAVRRENTDLLVAADKYLETHARGSQFFNVLRKKYFTDHRRISRRVRGRPERSGRISPYDDLFRKYGEEVEIDWRLLAAQAYQESSFDPKARSWAGAVGIMQIMPRTARELGISGDMRDPETGIRAGALYMRRLADRYNPKLPLAERLRFALGAYNVGPGHILDARRVARNEGLDPDIWFDNVERALPLLSRQPNARRARYGYCRCREPVRYVREIHERYNHYIRVAQ